MEKSCRFPDALQTKHESFAGFNSKVPTLSGYGLAVKAELSRRHQLLSRYRFLGYVWGQPAILLVAVEDIYTQAQLRKTLQVVMSATPGDVRKCSARGR
jgi:hypothetical protein